MSNAPILKDLNVHIKRYSKPILLLPIVLLALLAGIAGGWWRLGQHSPWLASFAPSHALYMIGGFLGSLISLERAMTVRKKAWLWVPLTNVCSVLAGLLGDWSLAILVQIVASAGLTVLLYLQTHRYNQTPLLLLTIGALCWLTGNLLFYKELFVATALPWWMAFLVFTIVGERLTLTKFLPTPRWAKNMLYFFLASYLISLFLPFHQTLSWMGPLMLLFIALWLSYFDIAKLLLFKKGRFSYIAAGIFTAYFWLVIHAFTSLTAVDSAFQYDLYIHTFFLGFVFSMIWAHAPIIFPLLFTSNISLYHPSLWVVWLIYQLSLLGRLWSAFYSFADLRLLYGQINGYSILAILLTMATIILWRRGIAKHALSSI